MVMRLVQTTRGRVALLVGVLAAVWLGSAAVAHVALDQFDDYGDALWSGVLHLLDPSSLHEDEGFDQRAVGLFQVVVGLTFLVGLVFTVIAEVVGSTLERIGQYDAPIRTHDHLLFIGGVDYLSPIISELVAETPSHERSAGRIVALAPASERDRRTEIDRELRRAARPLRADLVVGDVSGPDGLDLVSARTARTIVISPGSRVPILPEVADLEVVQQGVALRDYLEEVAERPPKVFLIFRRGRDVDAAWELFPRGWDAIVADRSLAAILRMAVVRPVFAHAVPVVGDAADTGFFPVRASELAGVPFAELNTRLSGGLPIGLVRDGDGDPDLVLAPHPDAAPAGDDRIMVLARDAQDAAERGDGEGPAPPADPGDLGTRPDGPRRLLIVGWNDLGAALLEEHAQAGDELSVTILSGLGGSAALSAYSPPPGLPVETRTGSETDPDALREALGAAHPDTVVVLSTPVSADLRTADARTVISVMQLRRLTEAERQPIIAQVFNPASAPLRGAADPRIHVLSSLGIVARAVSLLIHAPLAGLVMERMIGEGGLDVIEFRPPNGAPAPFAALYQGMLREGAVPLGFAPDGGVPLLAPDGRTPVRPGDAVLIARRQPAAR